MANPALTLTIRVRWMPLMIALCVLRMPGLATRLCIVFDKVPRG
jgi:hypothetical protein